MDLNTIFTAVFFVTIIGVICSFVICIASRLMSVKTDERAALILESLPGVNCGVCGYPGCAGYAEALVAGNTKTNLCTPGGNEVLTKISEILGVEAGSMERKTAVILCSGDFNTRQQKMNYSGVQSCQGVNQLFGGDNSCVFGCLGFGDCITACPGSAIYIQDGLAHIIPNLCTGCGLCVKVCPKKLISIEKANIPVIVACKNIEKGAITRKKCTNGCIGCSKCVRECPQTAIVMEDNLAVINYDKCNSCGKCIEACVTKCIISRLSHR